MSKRLLSLMLAGALICAPWLSAEAAQEVETTRALLTQTEEPAPLPDSVLYYGRVETILRDEDGAMTALRMSSERYGEYVMRLSEETVWIDSGNRTASDPAELAEGEGLYVFHSPISTRSMPPQSAAFAVVRNVPQDASCANYHKVEAVEKTEDGAFRITTDNGGLFLLADEKAGLSAYEGEAPEGFGEIKAGSHIMAWYGVVAMSYPGQAHVSHIMTLDAAEEPLTRAGFAAMLHAAKGSPVVNYAMDFSDVAQDASYAEAVRWAVSERLILGYGGRKFGPDDPMTREQLVVILWRQAGSPRLMDYPGLSEYSDVKDISRFAQPALAWAHQKGLVPAEGQLGPQDAVTTAEAEQMMQALSK